MSLLIVGSEATAPNNSGWARMTAASARQSPPSAIVTARFSTVLPGSCTDRAGRHGLNACESSLASPLTWADSSNSAAPADEINDSPPDSTPTPPQRLGFTSGVPFSYPENGPSTSPFSLAGQALPCITRRTITPSPTQPRRVGGWRGGRSWRWAAKPCEPKSFPLGCSSSLPWPGCSVSSPRPSNRACGSPAHGSPRSFTANIRRSPPGPERPGGIDSSLKTDQAELIIGGVEHHRTTESPTTFVTLGEESRQPHQRILSDLREPHRRVPIAEVARPSTKEPIHPFHDRAHAQQQPRPNRQLTDHIPGMCHRLVRWPPGEEPDPLDTAAALTAHPPMMKPQKVQALTVLGQMHDSGLAHLGRQPQVREQPNQMRERILGLPTAPAHDHHIVGVTHQNPVLTNLPHPINPVQIHIRQHRRQHSALRRPGHLPMHQPVAHHSCTQHHPQKPKHRLITDPFLDRLHQPVMRNRLETLGDIRLHHPPPPSPRFVDEDLQRIMSRASGPKPERTLTHIRLEDRLEHDLAGCLHNAVTNCRDR